MARNNRSTLTIVGMGPGSIQYLTVQARRTLRQADEVWLRTLNHPVGRWLQRSCVVHSFDDTFGQGASSQEAVDSIVRLLLDVARAQGRVVYGVPGNPLSDDGSARLAMSAARADGLLVDVVAGVSFLDPVLAALGLDPFEQGLQMLEAGRLVALRNDRWAGWLAGEVFLSTVPTLICGIESRALASGLKATLLERYPQTHEVTLVRAIGPRGDDRVSVLPLVRLDQRGAYDFRTCLYLPPLATLDDLRSFDTFRHIVARLRAPGGCPWDREQTHQSLKPNLIEESYEVLEALDEDDMAHLEEELGDLLLQIVLHAQLAAEEDSFAIGDVVAHISAKLIRRHPHVFGTRKVADSAEVMRNWEQIKHAEKAPGGEMPASLLGGVPKAMPALSHASSIQRRVADLGFDWADTAGALAKVAAEAREVAAAVDADERLSEFGDLLFALVSAARRLGVDPEEALRLANQRFMQRFTRLEGLLRAKGKSLRELSPRELDREWREAKDRADG